MVPVIGINIPLIGRYDTFIIIHDPNMILENKKDTPKDILVNLLGYFIITDKKQLDVLAK
jgi:hypothetical protein